MEAAPESPVRSKTAEKRRKEKVKDLQARMQAKVRERLERKRARKGVIEPRYDEVYYAGVQWLETISGESLPEQEGVVVFDPEIWKSKARFDPDV